MILIQKFCQTTALQNLKEAIQHLTFQRTSKVYFLSKPEAPGILTCGYFHTSLRDHPLHCWGHSSTEGSEKVGMYPTRLGLLKTGVGYTECLHSERPGEISHSHREVLQLVHAVWLLGSWCGYLGWSTFPSSHHVRFPLPS